MAEHLGVYPGTVTTVRADGAIKARIPHVLGNALSQWAPPQVPCGTPKPGDKVYVSFLGGDIRQPIYTGTRTPEILKPTPVTYKRASNIQDDALSAYAVGNIAVISGWVQVRASADLAKNAQLLSTVAFPFGRVAVPGPSLYATASTSDQVTPHVSSVRYDTTPKGIYVAARAGMHKTQWYHFGLVIPLQDA